MTAATSDASDTVTVRAPQRPNISTPIEVSSPSFSPGGTIDTAHVFNACGGKNVSPALAWKDFPKGTKSFAVTLFDPDAPTGSGYWHWLVCDIPASTTSLEASPGGEKLPAGAKTGYSDYGLSAYGGPCPPKGDKAHRYIFTVYALDVPSVDGVGKGTTGATFMFLMRGHVLAQGSLTGRFGH